jgi:PAS domain S-box-containing protein
MTHTPDSADGLNAPGAGQSGNGQHHRALVSMYEAALSVASDLDLPSLLQRIADLAREVVPSRYGALGVADTEGHIVEFYTSGITAEERARLGPIPQGHGLLGELVRTATPLLVPDISRHPRSYGFPPHHPPMKTLLGTPIVLGSRVLGNLYLTERMDGRPYDEADLELVQTLAAHAAAAIDRAQLYRQIETARANAVAQRDQVRVIVDQLPTAVLIHVPPDGRIELANDAALRLLLGGEPAATDGLQYGREFRMLEESGERIPQDRRLDVRALRGETTRNRQLLLERADGTRIPVLCQAAPLRGADGTVNRAVSVIQDITRLREAEQLKDDFLSLVSHEFRTPLTAIHGGARLLVAEGTRLEQETRQELLRDIAVESDRLDQMLSNMLSLAAIMAGRLQPATEPLLLNPLVRRVIQAASHRADHHTFVVDTPETLPPAEADAELLEQVLSNLYENAIKYSPNGGPIRTRLEERAGTIVISITDAGIGIVPEHVRTVFERFRRPGADPTIRGMGLGLYLSRLLVEAQGGTIWAESEGTGQGATFSIALPIPAEWHEDA